MKGLLISLQRNLNIIGLKLLHELMLTRGHDSHLLYLTRYDENHARRMGALKAFIDGLEPELIGISLTATESRAAASLTRLLKQWYPKTPVLWGGVHASTSPEDCAKYADYVCVGEGEQTLLDVGEAVDAGRDLKHINNIGWMEEGRFVLNPLYPLVQDLSIYPYARPVPENTHIQVYGAVEALTKTHLRRHMVFRGSLYRTVISRGCAHRCTYCCNDYFSKLYPDWGIRHRPVESVIEEIETAIQEGPPMAYISFMDDCLFASRKDYLDEFFSKYKARIRLPFIAKASPAFVSDKRLQEATDAGLAWMGVGLQSGCDRVCKDVFRRPITAELFLKAARTIAKYPIAVYYDVIVDNPFESEEEELSTVEVLMDIPKPYFLSLFSLALYEKTEIRDEVAKHFPERLEDATVKDFYVIRPTLPNALKFTAMTMPRSIMKRLLARYRREPNALTTRLAIRLARGVGRFVLQPPTYVWLLLRSQRGSVARTLRVLPHIVDLRFLSIFNVFDTNRDSTEE